jgi:uncharacterized protein
LANQYLYRLKAVRIGMLTQGPSEHEAAAVADHFAYLQRLHAEGRVLMAGRTQTADENTFGIVVFLADSDEAAQDLMQGDPALSRGVMTAELFPFRVALWSTSSPFDATR